MLKTYRRHSAKCTHRAKGADFTKCKCPIWADGTLNGQRYKRSLNLRDWGRAQRKIGQLEAPDAILSKTIKTAAALFLNHHADSSLQTRRKYARIMRNLEAFGKLHGISDVSETNVEAIDAYRATRKLSPLTWSKELQLLRQFFSFAVEREWIRSNPARKVKMPANIKPVVVEPYTAEEITRIITACDFIGRQDYERLRARAMILTMRFTALAIQDVACLERTKVQGGMIFIRRAKSGKPIYLPVTAELQAALDALPAPNGAPPNNPYYFWNGRSTRESVAKKAGRLLKSVFKLARVERAHAHRFRHTLATDILVNGGTEQDAANILGNSPAIIRKHYAQWTPALQHRTSELMQKIFRSGTFLVQTETLTAKC